jgi:hypothetical protein
MCIEKEDSEFLTIIVTALQHHITSQKGENIELKAGCVGL